MKADKAQIPADAPMQVSSAASADTIEQVRELLFGADKRATDSRLGDLELKLEKKIDELRADMQARFGDLEIRLLDLAKDTSARRAASIDDIGAAIANLGATIRGLGAETKAR